MLLRRLARKVHAGTTFGCSDPMKPGPLQSGVPGQKFVAEQVMEIAEVAVEMIAWWEKGHFQPGKSMELLLEDQKGVQGSIARRSHEPASTPAGRSVTTKRLRRQLSLSALLLKPVVRLAKRLGLYVTRDPNWLVYQDHLTRVLSTLKINCVLDVGSHHGDFAKWLRKIGYMGLIISFRAGRR